LEGLLKRVKSLLIGKFEVKQLAACMGQPIKVTWGWEDANHAVSAIRRLKVNGHLWPNKRNNMRIVKMYEVLLETSKISFRGIIF